MDRDQKSEGGPRAGGDLFIVDNSDAEWKGLRYLQEWAQISTAFDIATGFFEIGALLELDGAWQKLDKIRILMGSETTKRTRLALLEALKTSITAPEIEAAWNEYVPKHLLPRIRGFELMMAPYAVAHMKIGLRLRG